MQNSTNLKTSDIITSLTNEVYRIANNNPSGFTLNLKTMQLVNTGFVAAYKETQNSFGVSGLQNVIKYALLIGASVIGGWYNTDNGQYYFDCSQVFENLNDAAIFGVNNEQLAIFDLNTSTEIKLS
ncbi:hypothetical protein [Dysgonomonas sp. 25]|uniref:hypothetical protein n=1 Tax=Dysgonomonas sp. 25 TaxID=2302933 RepID=UPI002103E950|nr:hypothetical protein [Dysgonomonas sp. 25]